MDTLTSDIFPARPALRQVGWLIASILIALALLPSVARADSAGATINTLPDSSQLEGHVEVNHECGGVFKSEREQPCPWFAEAAQYPANTACPGVYDESHGVWLGPIEHGSVTSSGNFSFIPEASDVVLCLYVNAEGTSLVGHSHPFNTQTGSEVLPQSLGRQPSRAVLRVRVYNGCKAHIYADARGGGEEERGGTWSDAELWGPDKAKFLAVSGIQPWIVAVEGPPGDYRLRMHFDGNAALLPSPPATTTFRLRRCTK
jgi:hypothetical protein